MVSYTTHPKFWALSQHVPKRLRRVKYMKRNMNSNFSASYMQWSGKQVVTLRNARLNSRHNTLEVHRPEERNIMRLWWFLLNWRGVGTQYFGLFHESTVQDFDRLYTGWSVSFSCYDFTQLLLHTTRCEHHVMLLLSNFNYLFICVPT
jgi:hypothetical protein